MTPEVQRVLPHVATVVASPPETITPFYPTARWLTQRGAPIAAWMHRRDGPASPIGVVLSSSIGIEALFGYPAVIQWADALAAAGHLVIRIDPPGAGDSAGTYRSTGIVTRWQSAFVDAADVLRAHGVDHVALAGVRLGALVAATALEAARSSRLVAWAPYATGHAMTREMASFDRLFHHSVGPTPATGAAAAGEVDGAGARFGHDLAVALDRLRIDMIAVPADTQALIMPRDDLPGGTEFHDALAAQSARVVTVRVAGFAGAHGVPEHRIVPTSVFDTSIGWLASAAVTADGNGTLKNDADLARRISRPRLLLDADDATHIAVDGDRAEHAAIEHEVRFGPDGRLVGILAEPTDDRPRGPIVLLLNSGLIHHVGPHRQWVEMARRWAALGVPTLRFDLSGIAGSAAAPGTAINRPYPAAALDDIAAAMRFVRTEGYAEHGIILAGLCAGAQHAFRAALRTGDVDAIVMIDPIEYDQRDDDAVESAEWDNGRRAHAAYEWYSSRITDSQAWLRLLSGRADLGDVPLALVRKAGLVARGWASRLLPSKLSARLMGRRSDLGGDLVRLVRSGTRVHMIFAGNAPGLWYLRTYGGLALRILPRTKAFTLEIGDGADHTFSRWGWRRWLSDTVTAQILVERDRLAAASPR